MSLLVRGIASSLRLLKTFRDTDPWGVSNCNEYREDIRLCFRDLILGLVIGPGSKPRRRHPFQRVINWKIPARQKDDLSLKQTPFV